MPEGLKIVVGADVAPANQAIDRFSQNVTERFRGIGAAGQQMGNVLPPAINKANNALNKFSKTSSSATQATINLGRVIQDAPYGFIGIANNLNPLLESFQRLKAESGSTGGALKAFGKSLTGAGGVGLALSLVTTGLLIFQNGIQSFSRKAQQAKEATDQLKDSIKGIFSSVAKESTEVGSLVTILKNESETRERKLATIKELQSIQPDIFKNIKLEGDAVVGLDTAYKNYLDNLKNVIAAKIIQARLEQKIEQLLRLQGAAATQSEKNLLKAVKNFNKSRLEKTQGVDRFLLQDALDLPDKKIKEQSDRIQSDIDGLFKDLSEFSKSIKVKELDIKPDKLKFDFSLIEAGQRVKFNIAGTASIDLDKVKLVLLNKFKIPLTFKELFEETLSKELSNLVVKPNLKQAVVTDEALIAAAKLGADTAAAFNQAMQSGLTEGIGGFGEGIGKALTGGSIGDAFKAFAASIGAALEAMGKQIIGIGVAALLAKEALTKLFSNPALAIGAGVALVAAGSALKNILSGGIKGFAAGGLVTGPQLALIGEGSGTSRSNPEVVAPLDKLKSMLSGLSTGGRQVVYVTGRLRGNDMLLQNARTSRSQRRAGVR